MTNALRLVSTNKGHDPRDFALMAFGGGGAMHAVALAEELKVPRVIVPVNSSVFSAWGMLLTDLRRDYVQTHPMKLCNESADALKHQFDIMTEQALADYARDGVDAKAKGLLTECLADMRYAGQEHTVKVPVSFGADGMPDTEATRQTFHDTYEKRFTYQLEADVQIVNFHLVAKVEVQKPNLAKKAATGRSVTETVTGTRMVDFDQHGRHEATIYAGLEMDPGMELTGPAIIQEPSVTLVVSPGHKAHVDDFGNYHITLNFNGEG